MYTESDVLEREEKYEKDGKLCYIFQIEKNTWIDATNEKNFARKINHKSAKSQCTNARPKLIRKDGKHHLIIFSSRCIRKGEEIFYDYCEDKRKITDTVIERYPFLA